MAELKAPSQEEIAQLRAWFEANKAEVPKSIVEILIRMLVIYMSLAQSVVKSKQTLTRLREAMGILPKSERGRSAKLKACQTELNLEGMSEAERKQYEQIQKKRRQALNEAAQYARELKKLCPEKLPEQLEFDLADPLEMVFSTPSSERHREEHKQRVERMKEFDREKGLHSSFDSTKRMDLQILVTEATYQVETVTDPDTGKSVRASMDEVGPEGSTLTWRAIATLVKLIVGFAIPINRVSLLIGQPEFGSSQICRVLRWTAELLLPIYLYLAEALSDSGILSGDDTRTKILETTEPEDQDSLAIKIQEHLGWSWQKADGSGEKETLNVSLLIGRSHNQDPRSTIRLFRTHQGSVGNLLTRLLEWRNPKSGSLIFQGDLSSTNLPSLELRERFEMTLAGCAAHARRPFWRYREDDGMLCYFMLRGFLSLARVEHLIDAKGRTSVNVLRYRNRYSKRFWQALYNRCVAATSGTSPGRFTFRATNDCAADVWPPNTDLYRACMYVINHFEELTLYLNNPRLKYTNNDSERALRIEKCFLSSSKFTKTRNGRAVVDVLRTVNATCTAAGVDLTAYLRFVFKNRHNLQEYTEKFTPYAFALSLEKK